MHSIRDFFHIGGRRNGKAQKIEEIAARQVHKREAAEVRSRRSIADMLRDTFGDDVYDRANSPSTQMAVALNRKTDGPQYAGTVHKATIAKRRAANKRARVARRATRR